MGWVVGMTGRREELGLPIRFIADPYSTSPVQHRIAEVGSAVATLAHHQLSNYLESPLSTIAHLL